MKKISLLTFFVVASCLPAFAQAENAASQNALAKFEKYYNDGVYDSIFFQFSTETKAALPQERTRTFLTQMNARFGRITARTFENYQSGFGVYRTQFQKGVAMLQVAVNGTGEITGLFAKPAEEAAIPRNTTSMRLPFDGEWTVFWGGDTKEQNYHVATPFQRNAFDIVINNASGRSYKTDGKTNTDYYAFGQPILSPCEGTVVLAVDGVKDNNPGEMNPLYLPGNAVLLKTANNEYVLLAHLQQGSVKVKQGDKVTQGQALGLCGNSGNSSEPHLHFHLQHAEEFSRATGIKCYFGKLLVNGVLKTDYSPVKGDKIAAAR